MAQTTEWMNFNPQVHEKETGFRIHRICHNWQPWSHRYWLFLEQHIKITSTNKNENIQYTYNRNEIHQQNPEPTKITDDNIFAPLMHESDIGTQVEKDLESILNSDNS